MNIIFYVKLELKNLFEENINFLIIEQDEDSGGFFLFFHEDLNSNCIYDQWYTSIDEIYDMNNWDYLILKAPTSNGKTQLIKKIMALNEDRFKIVLIINFRRELNAEMVNNFNGWREDSEILCNYRIELYDTLKENNSGIIDCGKLKGGLATVLESLQSIKNHHKLNP